MRQRTQVRLRQSIRKSLLWLGLPALLVLALRLIWGWEAGHRLHRIRERLSAQGVPVEPAQLPDDAGIQPEQNAAYDLMDAMSITAFSGPGATILRDRPPGSSGFTLADAVAIKDLRTLNAAAIKRFDAAAHHSVTVFPREFLLGRPTAFELSLVALQFSRLLYASTLIAGDEHRDLDALQDLKRLLVLARITGACPIWLMHSYSGTCRKSAADAIERLDSSLSLRDADAASTAREVMQLLADDAEFQRNLSRAWAVTRVSTIELARSASREAWWIRPVFDDDCGRALQDMAASLPAFTAPNWRRAKPLLRGMSYETPTFLDGDVRVVELYVAQSDVDLARPHYEALASSRAAAILLAARLYAHQHGALPKRAEDLVPAFLEHLPLDPFADREEPLHYRLDPGGPTVWSVGSNGIDDGGITVRFDRGEKAFRFSNPDIPFGAAWRTASPPATATSAPQ